jgi:hypothetical protein
MRLLSRSETTPIVADDVRIGDPGEMAIHANSQPLMAAPS